MESDQSYHEQELLRLIAQGDEDAFSKLFDHYRDQIYDLTLKLTRSTTVAEEVTEDVFLRIWLRRACLEEIENFRAYLFTIARNEAYKILKQIAKNYRVIQLTEAEAVCQESPENYLIGKDYTSLLQKAIDKLSHQQREVYQLIKEKELKRSEVADMLHIKPETVKFHLAQAMKHIRAFCEFHLDLFIGFVAMLSCFI